MTTKRILIADDDRLVLELLGHVLSNHGFEVIRAQDGYQALQMTREHRPHLLILDINMPAGDGFSVVHRLQKMEGFDSIPVICMTAERSIRIETGAAVFQPFAVIYKPFFENDIMGLVREALGEEQSAAA